MNEKVLGCKCKEPACEHWRVIKVGRKTFLHCISCDERFKIAGLRAPKHEKIHWIDKAA
jgi:uncharacterized Zn-finger protein